jgi:hypothetical protein
MNSSILIEPKAGTGLPLDQSKSALIKSADALGKSFNMEAVCENNWGQATAPDKPKHTAEEWYFLREAVDSTPNRWLDLPSSVLTRN